MKRGALCLALITAFAPAALAQDQGQKPAPAPSAQDQGQESPYSEEQYRETQDLIDAMQAKIDRIRNAASERDREIEFLNKKVGEAIQIISSGREDNVTLRGTNAYLQGELQNVYETQDELSSRLTAVASEKEKAVTDLRTELSALSDRLSQEQETAAGLRAKLADLSAVLRSTATEKEAVEKQLDQARRALSADKEAIQSRRREIAGLKRDLAALGADKKRAEEALAEARRAASADRKAMERQLSEIADLKRDIAALREARARLEDEVAKLGRRLKSAAGGKARDLARYRSEFFGRLRQVLGDDPDIRVVGDRFVFQSEVLFASGSAELDPTGRAALTQMAETLKKVARKIPPDVNWILRVDGHTDRVPIRTSAYESNWELSTARATAVVKFLIRMGLAPERLAAAGFGEYHALDPRDDEIAYRRNRRIEFKLTQP